MKVMAVLKKPEDGIVNMRTRLGQISYPARLRGEPVRPDDNILPTTSRGEANIPSP